MKKFKRLFFVVADSMGIGASPDAAFYKNGGGDDTGSDTFASLCSVEGFSVPLLASLGIGNIDGVAACYPKTPSPRAAYGRLTEKSAGKDTVTGHWEMAGVISRCAMPTFPEGFPTSLLDSLSEKWGRGWLCNRPYSGTEVIRDFGEEHLESGKLIVYTSADSVMQIAAHESLVTPDELYAICAAAREALCGEYAVGRVIARPFEGTAPDFVRTARRRDFSLVPPKKTLCDLLCSAGREVIGVGKIGDIFAHRGITREIHTEGNDDGMKKTLAEAERDFEGLCFVNLVDFDMKYGHRRDTSGYAAAVCVLDRFLSDLTAKIKPGDAIILTADHGCDPSHIGTDHTREYVPCLIWGDGVQSVNLGTRESFADLGCTAAQLLGVSPEPLCGKSFAGEIV